MGFLASSLRALIPESKSAIASVVPTWDNNRAQIPQSSSYFRNAKDGYMLDELVFDCVEYRATSAGEPPMSAWVKTGSGEEKIEEHPVLDLFEHPNPFMGRSDFWGAVSMHLDIAGNAYIERVRSGSGKTVELWPLRPDRIRVIPDSQRFIAGYTYTVGDQQFRLDAKDVIRFKTRHPLDDYYGLPPLAVLAGRVDLDIWIRQFSEAFFRNAGVPAGLINIQRSVNQSEREAISRRFREMFGGPDGWHRIMVLDNGIASYSQMGANMDQLAMLELNQITETRILGVFGMYPSLIPTMAGIQGNRGQTAAVSDRQAFFETTMIPWFRSVDSTLSVALADEYPDIVRFEHDLSKVHALQEDEDKKHARWREDWKAGVVTLREVRAKIGLPDEPDEDGIVLVPTTMVPTHIDELLDPAALDAAEEAATPPAAAPGALPQNGTAGALPAANAPPAVPAANGRANGRQH